ncbi:haloacid dehalogenase [Paenibacillus sambharensis]|uniref:Haloacid dehalogenase n=1 Tax=Paenibacillus sambharensis TaxID=1803190 RepID=A0A2W1LE54_9BACL|nr:HAD-IIB family hydrolase [Paenibacillus sambharensis]PZD97083.1 haloacid dehalogenase [Paenibacillus sambharensis]
MNVIYNPAVTEYLIFFDFDETYYPHECLPEQLNKVYELELYLQQLARDYHVKTAWVTGSSVQQIQAKMKLAGMTQLPHFIASNLGTEMWEAGPDGQLVTVPAWAKIIKASGFSRRDVEDLISELKLTFNIVLHEQTQFGQSGYKMNYYYYPASAARIPYDLSIIRHLAANHGIGININMCNPKAGDPENAYDVDFIPAGSGKKAAVQFLVDYNQVPQSNTMAFGDSGNDIEMLRTVSHGYLLQNATAEAKSCHHNVAPYPYAEGILHVCRKFFGEPFR